LAEEETSLVDVAVRPIAIGGGGRKNAGRLIPPKPAGHRALNILILLSRARHVGFSSVARKARIFFFFTCQRLCLCKRCAIISNASCPQVSISQPGAGNSQRFTQKPRFFIQNPPGPLAQIGASVHNRSATRLFIDAQ
jgi:hypothetical protein